MPQIVANGLNKCNSPRLILPAIACGYSENMRGEAKRKNRAARLRELQRRYSYEEMARRCGGKASPSYFSQIGTEALPKGRKTPRGLSDDFASRLERAFNLPPNWFDTDPGVKDEAGKYIEPRPNNTHPGPDTQGFVPVISWVRAGSWDQAEDNHHAGDGEEWMPCPTSHGMHSYALRVQGDSMTAPYGRSYPDGSIIYVDPEQRGGVVSGDRVIAKINGDNQVTFKVFVEDAGRRFLKPLNPAYPVITDPFRILGKVIGTWIPE